MQVKFIKGSIKLNKKDAIITIPASMAKQLYKKKKSEECFLTVINGILQCSIIAPDVVIPMMILDEKQWVPLKD